MIMSFNSDGILDYDEIINVLQGQGFYRNPLIIELDLKNKETTPAKLSIEDPAVLELKALPSYLRYVFLGPNNTRLVIIMTNLNEG